MNESASIAVQQDSDGCQILTLVGEITVMQAAELHRESVRLVQQERDVLIDCEQTRSLDFAALQLLVALKEAVVTQRRTFRMRGLSQELAGLIALAGLDRHLELAEAPPAIGT